MTTKLLRKKISPADSSKRVLAGMEQKGKSANSPTLNSVKNSRSMVHANHVAATRVATANISTRKCV